jgi:hypothetical protein
VSATRTSPDQLPDLDTPAVPEWPVEWAAARAAKALSWLGRNYPECLASEALRPHEEAANAAAMADDKRRLHRSPQSLHASGARQGATDQTRCGVSVGRDVLAHYVRGGN